MVPFILKLDALCYQSSLTTFYTFSTLFLFSLFMPCSFVLRQFKWFQFGVVPKSKDGNKTLRRKEKQRAKEEEKLEKRRQKEEKLKKLAEEREKKKQKTKTSATVGKVQ